MVTITEAKIQAKRLEVFLKKENKNITRSSCLQAIAKIHSFKDWNTMSSLLSKEKSSSNKNEMCSLYNVSEYVFMIMDNHGSDGKFGENAYQVLTKIVLNMKTNRMIVDNITHKSFFLKKKSQYYFNEAINQLIAVKFIQASYNYDLKNNLIIAVNPFHFWKGDEDERNNAKTSYDAAISISGEDANFLNSNLLIDFIKTTLKENIKFDQISDVTIFIYLSEKYNSLNKKKKKLCFNLADSLNLEKHLLIKELYNICKKENIENPLSFFVLLLSRYDNLFTLYKIIFNENKISIFEKEKDNQLAYFPTGIE